MHFLPFSIDYCFLNFNLGPSDDKFGPILGLMKAPVPKSLKGFFSTEEGRILQIYSISMSYIHQLDIVIQTYDSRISQMRMVSK